MGGRVNGHLVNPARDPGRARAVQRHESFLTTNTTTTATVAITGSWSLDAEQTGADLPAQGWAGLRAGQGTGLGQT